MENRITDVETRIAKQKVAASKANSKKRVPSNVAKVEKDLKTLRATIQTIKAPDISVKPKKMKTRMLDGWRRMKRFFAGATS